MIPIVETDCREYLVTRSEMVKMLYKVLESYRFQLTGLSQTVKSTGTTGATAVQLPHDILGYLTIERIGIKKYPVKDGADLATIKSSNRAFCRIRLMGWECCLFVPITGIINMISET